jgi:putative membrane protein
MENMKYKIFLLAVFLATWAWSAYKPLHPDDWLLENYLVFLWIPIILLTARVFRLSNISYTLITIFMCLHVIGSHYTYSEVPFGFTLQDWFDADRNMYDRLVHFCYGFLLAYPIREVYVRIAHARGFWGLFFPVELTFAFSAVYELIEWWTARNVPIELGLAFLGSQGDVWDAQKDMGLAGLGAIIAMLLVLFIRLAIDKGYGKELKESFKIDHNDAPLGEEAIKRFTDKLKRYSA